MVVPVGFPGQGSKGTKLCVLTISSQDSKTLWQSNTNMAQVAAALDSNKKWDIVDLAALI
ncbi:hypothetical protein SAMN05660282_00830 [Corynebacterium spheniscorum]|uniref:Uncharacterized protein n=1 Tax=Corynebacterium spheniscorum TaxID=185761 RepID=A0A1I2RV90_9CORY|nr:hypothetical protein SAMN05660282_00830 [Corynebacterium spheniscorum]